MDTDDGHFGGSGEEVTEYLTRCYGTADRSDLGSTGTGGRDVRINSTEEAERSRGGLWRTWALRAYLRAEGRWASLPLLCFLHSTSLAR